MASAVPLSAASTKETTNYARLCRLLVDVGSQALRDTFDNIHPPAGLHGVLSRHSEHATLQSLKKKKILNPTQWGHLYPTTPSSVSSRSFDITLLMVLLRNICSLHPPATGWDSLPPPADTSKEANIARVKYYRNTVYGHASQASVDDATFNTHWQDISNALVALGGASYGAAINKLKNECMDPDTEDHYRKLLKQWKKDEDSIKDKLEEIEEMLKLLKEEKDNIKDRLGEVEGNIKDKLDQVENQVGLGAGVKRKNLSSGNLRSASRPKCSKPISRTPKDSPVVLKEGTPDDEVLERLAGEIICEWEKLGRRLLKTDAKVQAILKDRDCSEKAFTMLKKWKQSNGSKATFHVLYDALCSDLVERNDLAEEYCCVKEPTRQ